MNFLATTHLARRKIRHPVEAPFGECLRGFLSIMGMLTAGSLMLVPLTDSIYLSAPQR